MRIPLKSALFACAVWSASAAHLDDQAITREMIQQSGIVRMSDLMLLIEGWRGSTVDGFRWNIHPLESGGLEESNWLLTVDGQRIDPDAFGRRNLNMLLLNIRQIDSVVVSTTPQILDGHFSDAGMIHIHTSRPEPGASFHYRYAAGNETGDPGPYALTEHATCNVDRIANDHFTTVAFGLDNVWGKIGLSFNQFAATDPVLKERLSDYPWEWLRTYVFSPFLQMGVSAFGGRHNLYVGRASAGNAPCSAKDGSDLLRVSPFGKELPVETSILHSGLDGRFPIHPVWTIRYGYTHSASTVENAETYPIHFHWCRTTDRGRLAFQFKNPKGGAEIGFGYERLYFGAKHTRYSDRISLAKLYGAFHWSVVKTLRPSMDFHLTTDGRKTTLKTSIQTVWEWSPMYRIGFGVSVSERMQEENNAWWFWRDREVCFSDSMGAGCAYTCALPQDRHASVFMNWGCSRENASLGIRGFIHGYEGVLAGEPDILKEGCLSPTEASWNVAGGQVRFQYFLSRNMHARFFYIHARTFTRSNAFERAGLCFPGHKACLALNVLPATSFSLHADWTFFSATEWREIQDTDPFFEDGANGRVRGAHLLNLAAQKWMWEHRLRIGMMIFNCLNSPVQFHPMGAHFDLSVFFNVEIHVNPL